METETLLAPRGTSYGVSHPVYLGKILAERVNRQAGRIRCFEVQSDLVDGFVPRALQDETAG